MTAAAAELPRADLISRAIAAYFRRQVTCYPSRDHSRTESWDGREYVVLSDGQNLAAVYRIRRSDGILRRMKRPPRVIQP